MAGEASGRPRYDPSRTSTSFGTIYDGSGPRLFWNPGLSEISRRRSVLGEGVQIGKQRYRQEDRGRANVLVPVPGPLASREELERRLAPLNPVFDYPFAGGVFGIASAAGVSPEMRDAMTSIAAGANAVMVGAAPLGARVRGPLQPPPRQPPLATLPRPAIRYGADSERTGDGLATATVNRPMLKTGKRPREGLVTPGLDEGEKRDRSHKIAAVLGGTASSPQEAVTLHRYVNRGPMSGYEKAIAKRVRQGEVVEYFVKPLYHSRSAAPSAVVLSANGSRGPFTPKIIANQPKKAR